MSHRSIPVLHNQATAQYNDRTETDRSLDLNTDENQNKDKGQTAAPGEVMTNKRRKVMISIE